LKSDRYFEPEEYEVSNHLKSQNQNSIESWFQTLSIYDSNHPFSNQPYNILKSRTTIKILYIIVMIDEIAESYEGFMRLDNGGMKFKRESIIEGLELLGFEAKQLGR
jgi:hypothetical protein